MNSELHVVLGASGTIGQAVLAELTNKNLKARAVQRGKEIPEVETINADLLDSKQTADAIKGATHVYLCVAIPYNTRQWQREWPMVMENVIMACEMEKAKLIFLDNIYLYGPSPLGVPFDETQEQKPVSKKGMVRKKIADMLVLAHKTGRIQAVIGRSADFYGPSRNSALYNSFLENMIKGKAPQSLGKLDVPHTYAFTGDNGRALVSLALDETTYGQVWHLPVSETITARGVAEAFNGILGTNYKVSMIPRPLVSLLGLFVPIIKEMQEMLYQFDNPYIMSSEKFTRHFPEFQVTKLEDGLKEMAESFTNNTVRI